MDKVYLNKATDEEEEKGRNSEQVQVRSVD